MFFIGIIMIMEGVLDILLIQYYKYYLNNKPKELLISNQNHFNLDKKSKIFIFINRW